MNVEGGGLGHIVKRWIIYNMARQRQTHYLLTMTSPWHHLDGRNSYSTKCSCQHRLPINRIIVCFIVKLQHVQAFVSLLAQGQRTCYPPPHTPSPTPAHFPPLLLLAARHFRSGVLLHIVKPWTVRNSAWRRTISHPGIGITGLPSAGRAEGCVFVHKRGRGEEGCSPLTYILSQCWGNLRRPRAENVRLMGLIPFFKSYQMPQDLKERRSELTSVWSSMSVCFFLSAF